MGGADTEVPVRPVRAMKSYQYDAAQASTSAPASPSTKGAPVTPTPATTAAPAKAAPTSVPMKRMLSAGQMSGQPEVALLRPAAARPAPRPVARPATRSAPRPATRTAHHQGGVDEIRNLLRVQDTMGVRAAKGHGVST